MSKDYLVHKAIELAKVAKRDLSRVTSQLEQGSYQLYAKYDGCCALLFFNEYGDFTEAKSRTGEPAPSMSNIGIAISQAQNDAIRDAGGLVVIGEAWWPGKGEFNKISGAFRRQKPSDKLTLAIHDIITLDAYNSGTDETPWEERIERLRELDDDLHYKVFFASRFPYLGPKSAQEKCNELVALGGFDGAILRNPSAPWIKGHNGNDGACIKVKQKLSFDLRVTEVNTATGEKTGRPVYKLVVDFRGQPLGVGSGVPHDLADVPVVGDIIEVEAMDYSSDGLLREPRFKGIRTDKINPDT